ncbi:hypothetical protein [Pyxidicoccus parkwayensis]|nr:hypothetical protein [Pyxidicoccus parkwaysis]
MTLFIAAEERFSTTMRAASSSLRPSAGGRRTTWLDSAERTH